MPVQKAYDYSEKHKGEDRYNTEQVFGYSIDDYYHTNQSGISNRPKTKRSYLEKLTSRDKN